MLTADYMRSKLRVSGMGGDLCLGRGDLSVVLWLHDFTVTLIRFR